MFPLRPTCAKSLLRPYKTKADAQQHSDDLLIHVLRLQHKEEKRDLTMRVNHIQHLLPSDLNPIYLCKRAPPYLKRKKLYHKLFTLQRYNISFKQIQPLFPKSKTKVSSLHKTNNTRERDYCTRECNK